MKKLLFCGLIVAVSMSQAAIVYQIDINDNIASKTWVYTQHGFSEAQALNADLVLLHLNTYGGELSFADSIRTRILNSDITTIAFIDNNAASAGALISIACDRIYMRKGASLGAATVVSSTDGKQMPDKYQSYMRATMRSTAEAHGKDTLGRWKRDPLIAEAMVDNRTMIPNIIDSGKTLTFTTEEAIANHYCEGVAETVADVLEQEGYSTGEFKLTVYKPSFYDTLKGILTNTFFQSLLIMFIIGGIYFELQTPGIGFPLIVSIVASVLYFAPLYIDGLAVNWEIIIFFIGIMLLILEIFVIPGFGIAGISGIFCVIFGLVMSLLNNVNFNFERVRLPDFGEAIFTVFLGLLLTFCSILYLSHKIGSRGIFGKLALKTAQEKESGFVGVPTEHRSLIGKSGITITDLRPSGKVEIDGKCYDAVSNHGGFITKGTPISVIRYETGQVYVED